VDDEWRRVASGCQEEAAQSKIVKEIQVYTSHALCSNVGLFRFLHSHNVQTFSAHFLQINASVISSSF